MPKNTAIQLTTYEKGQVQQVKSYTDSHLNEALVPDEIAIQWGISAYKLKAGFIQFFGSSFACYVKSRRMEKARVLLLTTNKILYDIAGECGYRDETSFSRAFKNCFGSPPDAFRRQ